MEQQKESIRPDEEQAHHELKLVQLANQHKEELVAAQNGHSFVAFKTNVNIGDRLERPGR